MNHCSSTSFFGIFLYILFLTSYFSSYFFLLQFDLILVACRLQTSHKLMIHDNQVTCLHKFQVMIMHGQGAEHACSQPCDGSMCSSIDESFQFNVSLQHVIVYIVLIVNIFSISSYFLLQFKRKCIPIVGYGLDCSNGNKPFLFNSFLEEHLIVIAIIIKQEYNCVLVYLECLRTKFIALGQENQRLLKDLQGNVEKARQHEELTQRLCASSSSISCRQLEDKVVTCNTSISNMEIISKQKYLCFG